MLKVYVTTQKYYSHPVSRYKSFNTFSGRSGGIDRNDPILNKVCNVDFRCLQRLLAWSGRYKTFLGGNIDFPKIKRLNKICSGVSTSTKMWKQCYFKLNYTLTLYFAFKIALLLMFQLRGKLENLDFLQKSFITSRTGP